MIRRSAIYLLLFALPLASTTTGGEAQKVEDEGLGDESMIQFKQNSTSIEEISTVISSGKGKMRASRGSSPPSRASRSHTTS